MTLGLCRWRRRGEGGVQWQCGVPCPSGAVSYREAGLLCAACPPRAVIFFLSLRHPPPGWGEQAGPIRLNCIGGVVCSYGDETG